MKVYICSSLRDEPYKHVTALLDKVVPAFPGTIVLRPSLGGDSNKVAHVIQDVGMIREADELWVMGEYGRDCSWDIGFAMGIGKKVRVFVDETNRHLLEQDWMVLYGDANKTVTYEEV
jgi:hypothetical protein